MKKLSAAMATSLMRTGLPPVHPVVQNLLVKYLFLVTDQ